MILYAFNYKLNWVTIINWIYYKGFLNNFSGNDVSNDMNVEVKQFVHEYLAKYPEVRHRYKYCVVCIHCLVYQLYLNYLKKMLY